MQAPPAHGLSEPWRHPGEAVGNPWRELTPPLSANSGAVGPYAIWRERPTPFSNEP